MLVPNQWIKMIWSGRIKKWYVDKGYEYTGNGNEFLVRAEDLSPGSGKRVKCVCDYCGRESITPYSLYFRSTKGGTLKYACNHCGFRKFSEYTTKDMRQESFDAFLDFCTENDYIPISTIDDYVNPHSKLTYICPIHGERETDYSRIHQNCKCSKCADIDVANKRKPTKEKIIEIVASKNGDELLNPEEYTRQKDPNLKIKCGSCGNVFTTSLSSIIAGDGKCRDCARKRLVEVRTNTIDYVKSIIESKNGNTWINQDEYINSNTNNLKIRCGSCGRIFVKSLNNYQASSTGKCSDCNGKSQGETYVSLILDKYNIKYDRQKAFDDCADKSSLLFDFYLPAYNLCIEFDGQHHYSPVWGEDQLKATLLHDGMKDNYCRWNNIGMLRIPYWERDNMEQIIINKLNSISKKYA